MSPPSVNRSSYPALRTALDDTPIVVLHGPRQSGKSTLARLIANDLGAEYFTLDELSVLAAAREDPVSFVRGLGRRVVIDEIQRAPDLYLPIKAEVDKNRCAGRFLLTGSAHVLSVPRLADAFVGRMELFTLWPFSQGEIENRATDFIALLFDDRPFPSLSVPSDVALEQRILRGGFPEIQVRDSIERRRAWMHAYLSTIVQRDVRDLSNIAGIADMPRLFAAMSARAAALVNHADLARDAGMNNATLKRYVSLLHAVFLVASVPAWHSNRLKRAIKSHKLYFSDTGLLAHLLDANESRLARDPRMRGVLYENFVYTELVKQLEWSKTRAQIYHYRSYEGKEVDFVVEDFQRQRIAGVEVKSAATVYTFDFDGLRALQQLAGDSFHRGVVLYSGDRIVPFGERLFAVPIEFLWKHR